MPERPDLNPYLGQHAKVTVDRPLGSRHPQHADILYTVNYGFVPGTLSGDGHPIDAYILGVDKPLSEFEGVVIAIVVRADDAEDKLVVAAEGRRFSVEEIEALVRFQEKFFISHVVM
jgi:inorganic pyrophosphatase